MSLSRKIQQLIAFDIKDLDTENMGSWPITIKTIIGMVVFIGVSAAGIFFHVIDLQQQLAKSGQQEQALKWQFERKAQRAASLQAYRQQAAAMEATFAALISQLPNDTEVPGLLDDMTNKGLINGLEINSITLGNEQVEEFYIEQPIQIEVSGKYHGIGAFVSGIAGLPRIVTLHDFEISQQKDLPILAMKITAKTYRYKVPSKQDDA